jgi:methylenetetrahydrofolate dehydrogenase (NADP+)/methenyltetrahydrofolate cyclohydrolase
MSEKLILDGNVVANAVKEELKGRIEALKAKGVTPCLATILVGDDSSSETYVRKAWN